MRAPHPMVENGLVQMSLLVFPISRGRKLLVVIFGSCVKTNCSIEEKFPYSLFEVVVSIISFVQNSRRLLKGKSAYQQKKETKGLDLKLRKNIKTKKKLLIKILRAKKNNLK